MTLNDTLRACLTALVFLGCGALPARTEVLPRGLVEGPPGTAVTIVDGDTLLLGDGRKVRLVGIQTPKLPLGRVGFKKWPLADEAKAALAALTQDRRLVVAFGGARADRHGRALAHLVRSADRLWVQGEMLRRGMARVYSFPDNRKAVARMLVLERQARAEKRGIWGHPFYAFALFASLSAESSRLWRANWCGCGVGSDCLTDL
jgi:endonuclease YncB( thermonuclease family)